MTDCPHTSLTPTAEGFVCRKCGTALPPNHFCPDCQRHELREMGRTEAVKIVTIPCDVHRG